MKAANCGVSANLLQPVGMSMGRDRFSTSAKYIKYLRKRFDACAHRHALVSTGFRALKVKLNGILADGLVLRDAERLGRTQVATLEFRAQRELFDKDWSDTVSKALMELLVVSFDGNRDLAQQALYSMMRSVILEDVAQPGLGVAAAVSHSIHMFFHQPGVLPSARFHQLEVATQASGVNLSVSQPLLAQALFAALSGAVGGNQGAPVVGNGVGHVAGNGNVVVVGNVHGPLGAVAAPAATGIGANLPAVV